MRCSLPSKTRRYLLTSGRTVSESFTSSSPVPSEDSSSTYSASSDSVSIKAVTTEYGSS